MKNLLIILVSIIFLQHTHAQNIDTVYSFVPKIAKGFKIISILDSSCANIYCVQFEKDSSRKYLKVIVYKKSRKIAEGRYINFNVKPSYALVIDTGTGATKREVRKLEIEYLRDGYWYIYKGKREKQIYYHEGHKLKIKTE